MRTVHHRSTGVGELNPDGEKAIIYYGLAERIPRAELKQYSIIDQVAPDELLRGIPQEDGTVAVAIEDGIERSDAFDHDTGDLLILWRIPYALQPGTAARARVLAGEELTDVPPQGNA